MSRLIKIVLPIVILVIGVGIYKYQVSNKPVPAKAQRVKNLPKVRLAVAETAETSAKAQGFGTVEAAKSISIVSDVAGRVVTVAPNLKSGGMFAKGEVMFTIETETYEAALAAAQASLRSAELELAKIEQSAGVSVSEWEIWNKGVEKPAQPSPLVKYEPQLASARASVDYASKNVKKAKIDLDKTVYRAPFACIVSAESIEPGMVVRTGESLGTIVGSQEYEVVVPVLAANESAVTASENPAKASKVKITLHEGAKSWQWQGYISRVLPDADAKTAMIKVVVTVPQPNRKQTGKPPLTIGSNVEAVIDGNMMSGLISLPKEALKEGDSVWVVKDGVLAVRNVTVAAFGENNVFVSEGISSGESAVITRLNGVVDGMKVETVGENK
jgi:RND family efflux transporter MFP subunit